MLSGSFAIPPYDRNKPKSGVEMHKVSLTKAAPRKEISCGAFCAFKTYGFASEPGDQGNQNDEPTLPVENDVGVGHMSLFFHFTEELSTVGRIALLKLQESPVREAPDGVRNGSSSERLLVYLASGRKRSLLALHGKAEAQVYSSQFADVHATALSQGPDRISQLLSFGQPSEAQQ